MTLLDRVYTASECRAMDQSAIHDYGIPSFTLMQSAGKGAFDCLQKNWPQCQTVTVVAGSGNNAGDGYVLAELAHKAGLDLFVQQVGDPNKLKGDALTAWNAMQASKVPWGMEFRNADTVVDALLGTGLGNEARTNYQQAIDQVNLSRPHVLSLDVPSGVDATTGSAEVYDPIVADVTCMFGGAKLGLYTGPGIRFRGTTEVIDIGIPAEVYDKIPGIPILERMIDHPVLPPRDPVGHKYQFGHVVIAGGDHGTGGAVILAAEAALRTGAGLVTVMTRESHINTILARRPEVMTVDPKNKDSVSNLLQRADVVAVGPGLGTDEWGMNILKIVLSTKDIATVIDADGLRLTRDLGLNLPNNTILTPHSGEAGYLLGVSSKEIERNRPHWVKELSQRFDCVAILKGPGSLVAAEGELRYVSENVNPALATAGSGDVFTGIVATAYAQLKDSFEAAKAGIHLHGEAGKQAASQTKGKSVIASDVIEGIRLS